jgi:hypothetical protein
MKAKKVSELPPPPSLMASLLAGFDAITRSVGLILFPVALDILLWLGPHLNIGRVVDEYWRQMAAFSGSGTAGSAEFLQSNQELWNYFGENMNLFALLRAYPVGITSLMASRLPASIPGGGAPNTLYLSSVWEIVVLSLTITVIGLTIGSLYFQGVSEAALSKKVNWPAVLKRWPRATVQVFLLALVWLVLFIAVSIPASCIISALVITSPALSRIALLLFLAGLMWLIFPLLLSAHGIFVYGNTVLLSLKKSLTLTRMTLPSTGMLFLAALTISQGLDILWRIPSESSWFTLVGIFGHAFVTTGLLSATFIYYRNADRWVQRVFAYWNQFSTVQPKSLS